MGKIIFWLVVFFVALLALRLVNVANSRSRGNGAAREGKGKRDTATVRCVNCGVYVPKAEALEGPGGPVCGDPKCFPAGAGGKR